jgi:hypothetical protein
MESGQQLHLECASGIAGDMFLGACVDLGVPMELLQDTVRRLGLPGVTIETRRARRGGIEGVRFRVLGDGVPLEGPDPEEDAERDKTQSPAHEHRRARARHDPEPDHGRESRGRHPMDNEHERHREGAPHTEHLDRGHRAPPADAGRDLDGILAILEAADLEVEVKERSIELFRALADVEGAVHGIAPTEVHFHEVGAVDAIVDLTCACAALHHLLPRSVSCGEVVVGGGTAGTAHGVVPVPAPATARLLEGIPTRGGGQGELVTPTGALILRSFVDHFGAQPAMTTLAHGYGLGRRELDDRANAVRITSGHPNSGARPSVAVVECQVDDLTPEGCGYLLERLLELGALDVYLTPLQMKKGRPGSLVTMLCRETHRDALAIELLRESGSLGCRYYQAERLEAEREIHTVSTELGAVRVKVGRLGGEILVQAPEYEDCKRLAREHGVPWRTVFLAALMASRGQTK